MGMVSPAFDQTDFRGRNDDGGEVGATWIESANTDWSQRPGQNFRIRFVVAETNGGSSNNSTIQLQYNLNGAGWNDVNGTSSVVQSSASGNFSDGDPTTQQIGSGTFFQGEMEEVDGLCDNGRLDFSGSDETEVEYCLQLIGADVSAGDTIEFRVLVNGSTITYTNTPTVTSASGSLDQDSYRGRNDDGGESTATWVESVNTGWFQLPDTVFRLRFLVQEFDGLGVNNAVLQLQYNLNGSGWNDVTGSSSVVQVATSSNFAEGDSTTQQIGSGTFVSGEMDENEGEAGDVNNNIDFTGNDETEVEYCVQILGTDTSFRDTVELRVTFSDGTPLSSYTNTAEVTVSSPAGYKIVTTSTGAIVTNPNGSIKTEM